MQIKTDPNFPGVIIATDDQNFEHPFFPMDGRSYEEGRLWTVVIGPNTVRHFTHLTDPSAPPVVISITPTTPAAPPFSSEMN